MSKQSMEPIEFKVGDRASMDRYITDAVATMIKSAGEKPTQGILVRRVGDGQVVISFSDAVPVGYTEQLDCR